MPRDAILTLGHSNHPVERFKELLAESDVDVLVDVRSWPRSRYVDWADRASLPDTVAAVNVKYLFLGDQLGGRPDDGSFYDREGHVLYGKVAKTEDFRAGIERLKRGISQWRVAIMCSEENPEHCHRRLLVAKVLLEEGIAVTHIRGDGRQEAEPGPIDLSAGVLFADEERVWRSSRSVSRKRPPKTSLAA
ncbi:MAG: hypothetical protein QOE56_144 [Solirubrobacterales bacterium]|jgi:uncharacterized protein (DUF488 family)|nr:hypothetical protein [Solirubrobacterales bacterium]